MRNTRPTFAAGFGKTFSPATRNPTGCTSACKPCRCAWPVCRMASAVPICWMTCTKHKPTMPIGMACSAGCICRICAAPCITPLCDWRPSWISLRRVNNRPATIATATVWRNSPFTTTPCRRLPSWMGMLPCVNWTTTGCTTILATPCAAKPSTTSTRFANTAVTAVNTKGTASPRRMTAWLSNTTSTPATC